MPRPGPSHYLVILFISILCCLTVSIDAQVSCTPVFTNEYKAYTNVAPDAVKVLSDGTMLVAGKGLAGLSANYDGFVARLNPNGTQLWSYFIGGDGDDNFTGIVLLNDGTTILYGSTQSFGHPEGKGWLVHIDASGTVLSSFLLGSATTTNEQIKSVLQYTDGDIAGTFTVNDGTAASDPVVFKMGLDGTLRWTSRFDNGDNDSFTGLAFSGDTLYAAGYYTTAGTKRAVITLLNVNSGANLSSTNIYYGDPAYHEEISGLEIYGGMISYGLYVTGVSGGSFTNEIILVQTDLAGKLLTPSTYASDAASDIGGSTILVPMRTADSGFFVLRTVNGSLNYGSPGINKINKYGVVEWGLGIIPMYDYATMPGIDRTSDGGVVTVGYYNTYLAGFADVMRLVRMTASGELGSCNLPTATMASGTMSFQQQAFTWASEPAINPISQAVTPNAPVAAPMSLFSNSPESPCSSSVCVDNTPIPAGCNKTYNITYSTDRSSEIGDVIPTIDGGRLAVGSLTMPTTYQSPSVDGLVIKYQSNGAVAWAKNYNFSPGYDLSFGRVIMLADGSMLAVGNDYYDIDHGAYADIVMMKFDLNGNVIWVKSLGEASMSDVGATPDGGFILLSGSIVIRYDANANIVWQKTVTHAWTIAQYLSVFCSGSHVDIAFHSDVYGNQVGVDRLDLATGNEVWSQSYTTGSTSAAVNRVISLHDSVYLFVYNYIQYAAAPVTNLVIKLDTLGQLYEAQTWGADPLNVTVNPPTVTLSADGNFVLASQISVAGSNSFLLTKLKPGGTTLWSNNFTSIPYIPYNLHTQGKGFIVPGVQPVVHSGSPNFTNSAILKLDSSGQFEAGAAAGCQTTPRPFIVSTYTAVSPVSNALTSVLPFTFPVVNGSVYSQNTAISPTLMCYTPGNCNAVTMEQKGAACALGDTLVYYLDNSSNCGAAATWNYDPTFFRPGASSGDSIELIVQQAGSSTVSAQVEGYCSMTLQSKVANIQLSTTKLDLGPDTVVCDNSSITLAASPGFASYLWNDNSTKTDLVVNAPGKYYVNATDQCGGLHSDTVLVTAADSLFHLTPDTITCNQDPITLEASSGYTDYQWSPAYDLQSQGSKALVFPATTTTYTLTAQRSPGCTVTRSVAVTALSSPPISLGDDTSICTGDTLSLDAGAAFNSYQWNTGATSEKIYISQPGVYAVAALFSNGCTSRDTFQLIDLYTIAKPSLEQDSVLCLGSDKILNAGPGYTSYVWSNGSTGTSIDISQTGVYWVSVTDEHGCQTSDTARVLLTAPPPVGFLPSDTTICQYGDLVITTLQPFVSYSWSDLSSGSSLTVKDPGTYRVTVTNRNGCVGRDSILVTGKECLLGLFVPNAFSPNGDGHNDRFRPLCYGNAAQFYFAVFNRWGQRVFETQSVTSEGWDGTINGTPSPAGTYVWLCRYQIDGEPVAMKRGTVILLR
jgi:gliding motility-associated-like protein